MKAFLSAVIAWIKAHIWQTILIGVASVGVITTAITLPIVLSDNSGKDTQEKVNPEPAPTPGPTPVVKKYTINITNNTTECGTVEMKAGGVTITSGSQVDQGTQVTLLFTLTDDIYHLETLSINNDFVSATADEPYVFTADDSVANNQVINIIFYFAGSPIPE